MLSVIIVSYNTKNLLRKCLQKLFTYAPQTEMEVFVVDNNSEDDSGKMIQEEFEQVTLIANTENRGFAAANNQAWLRSTGKYVLLLNPDAFVQEHSVSNAISFMDAHPECGLCGGSLVKPDGTPDPSARKFPNFLSKLFTISGLRNRFPHSVIFAGHEYGDVVHSNAIEVDWVPGTFTLLRREMLEKTGLFDERFYIYYEETDLCKTAKKMGWKVYCLPDAEVVHVGGACSKTRKDEEFDTGGAQILKFRMRSEWLYYRKNCGLSAVFASAGVEACWHILRWIVTFLPCRKNGAEKRQYSATFLAEIWHSLLDTRAGSLTPPTPW